MVKHILQLRVGQENYIVLTNPETRCGATALVKKFIQRQQSEKMVRYILAQMTACSMQLILMVLKNGVTLPTE